jgi:hypothetical protein
MKLEGHFASRKAQVMAPIMKTLYTNEQLCLHQSKVFFSFSELNGSGYYCKSPLQDACCGLA